jgi:hypothetical protein
VVLGSLVSQELIRPIARHIHPAMMLCIIAFLAVHLLSGNVRRRLGTVPPEPDPPRRQPTLRLIESTEIVRAVS